MMYVLNDLSLRPLESYGVACAVLEKFVKINARLKEIGFDEMRVVENSLTNIYLFPFYGYHKIDLWLIDERVNYDTRLRFKEIVSSFPVIAENEVSELEMFERSDFIKEIDSKKHIAKGLGGAFILDTLAISFDTDNEWKKELVDVEHVYLDEKTDISSEIVHVRNVCLEENIDSHLKWWERKRLESLESINEFWDMRKVWFPHIDFCPEVEKQLQKIGMSKYFNQIVARINSLNNYLKDWKNGSFNYKEVNENTNLNISPESETTRNKFGALRRFSIPGQGKRMFDLHIKTGDLRFHFYPDNENLKLYIGYIGRHLRIASQD